jgi:hypothetical protein
MRPYTLAEARWILSHVYCVHHVPEDGAAGFSVAWIPGMAEHECSQCGDRCGADLRIWIASEAAARAWLAVENAAVTAP